MSLNNERSTSSICYLSMCKYDLFLYDLHRGSFHFFLQLTFCTLLQQFQQQITRAKLSGQFQLISPKQLNPPLLYTSYITID